MGFEYIVIVRRIVRIASLSVIAWAFVESETIQNA